jgi:elongation factor G
MEAAKERNIPRAIVVNKIDAPDINLETLVENLRETFGPECIPINLPTNKGKAVVDTLLNVEGTADFDTVKRCHAAILDQIVEMDENLMEKYLGGDEPDYDALHPAFEKAMDEAHVIPIVFTDAKSGVGVKEFLDTIVKHYPSPVEGNLRPIYIGDGATEQPLTYKEDVAGPLLAHVFKVTTDPFVGKLSLFRVHEGKATGQSQVIIGHSKKPIKLGHVFHLQGKEHKEADAIIAGDIGAVAKIEEFKAGDILHEDHALDTVHMKKETVPMPMYGLAIAPKNRGDETKISGALHKIEEEDPTFRINIDRQTHELVIYGMGELHLRLVLERLKNRGLDVDTKPPKIAYKETILGKAEGHHRHRKQTGGSGQFGEVYLRIEPLERGGGFEFVDEIFGGTIPGQFVPAVEKGVRDLFDIGAIAGYPMQDIRVIVYDGKHHPVDSKEVAFRAAGKYAFKDAFLKAKPVLLEPVVTMTVTVPEDKVGSITGDLSGRRGRIQGTDMLPGGMAQIVAQAPLSEVMQYQSQLKSVTGGQGSFTMELSHYDPVPPHVQQQIIAQWKPKAEEE